MGIPIYLLPHSPYFPYWNSRPRIAVVYAMVTFSASAVDTSTVRKPAIKALDLEVAAIVRFFFRVPAFAPDHGSIYILILYQLHLVCSRWFSIVQQPSFTACRQSSCHRTRLAITRLLRSQIRKNISSCQNIYFRYNLVLKLYLYQIWIPVGFTVDI
mgnify:CR=1 FL=1